MILYVSNGYKVYETCMDRPNSDWTGKAEHIINERDPKNAELIAKIKAFTPYYDYVLDDDGKLIDVVQTDVPDIDNEEEHTDPIVELQDEIRVLKAQNQALSQSNQMLEECLVEMAEIVYA